MTCQEIGNKLLMGPGALTEAEEAHVLSCAACGRAFAEAVFFERKLKAAFDVAPEREIAFNPDRAVNINRRRIAFGGMTALAAGIAAVAIGTQMPFAELPSEVMIHLKPYTLASLDQVADERLRGVLENAGARLVAAPEAITYASNCAIRRRTAAHLVLRQEGLPVSVFLMPQVEVDAVEEFFDGPWSGRIEPFGNGGVALIALEARLLDGASGALRRIVSAS
jgi:predicted dienelactone hydrolase